MQWFSKAAESGQARAQFELGSGYLSGSGVRQNDAEAYKWMKKASDQHFVEADLFLGYFYETGRGQGEGATANLTQALASYRLAATSDYGNIKKQASDRISRVTQSLHSTTESRTPSQSVATSSDADKVVTGLLLLGAIAWALNSLSEEKADKVESTGHYECPSNRHLVATQCWPNQSFVSCWSGPQKWDNQLRLKIH